MGVFAKQLFRDCSVLAVARLTILTVLARCAAPSTEADVDHDSGLARALATPRTIQTAGQDGQHHLESRSITTGVYYHRMTIGRSGPLGQIVGHYGRRIIRCDASGR